MKKSWPQQVILFSSRARDEARGDSDVDLLVVMEFEGTAFEQAREIRLALHDILVPKDIIVTSPEDSLTGGKIELAGSNGRRRGKASLLYPRS